MKVIKFGGTSLASGMQFKKVLNIMQADNKRRLMVVSAPGKRNKTDIKITDLLIESAEAQLASGTGDKILAMVIARYAEIHEILKLPAKVMDEIEHDFKKRLSTDLTSRNEYMDLMKAGGEDNSARLMAAYLNSVGMPARYLDPRQAGLLLSEEFGNARVLPESYEKLNHLGSLKEIGVFPGFFGYTPSGKLVTFPRGGSDISGAILAAAVKAEVYENFTDVDSVFTVNPKIVPQARPITELTYREMRELAYAGFTVFHDEALLPVYEAGIPVWILNTNNPAAAGTKLVLHRKLNPAVPVSGIASDKGFASLFISKYMMNREVGFGRRILQILEEENISYEHTPSGIDNISVIIRETQFSPATENRVIHRIREELKVDSVEIERDLALIMIVGEGMSHNIGIATKATASFSRSNVNIEMINQGSSEVSMMFGVKGADMERAVKGLYEEFFPSN